MPIYLTNGIYDLSEVRGCLLLRSRTWSLNHRCRLTQVCGKHPNLPEPTTQAAKAAPQTTASNGNDNSNANSNVNSDGNSNNNDDTITVTGSGGNSNSDNVNNNGNGNGITPAVTSIPVFQGSDQQKTNKSMSGLAPGGIAGVVVAAVVVVLLIVGAVIVVLKLRLVKPSVANKDATAQLQP